MKGLLLRRRKLGLGSCRGIRDASTTGLDFVRNDSMKHEDFKGIDFVFRWGCTSNVPKGHLTTVVNVAAAIHLIGDKTRFRKLLRNDQPELIPETFFSMDEILAKDEIGPLIIRPKHHAQGKHVYLVRTPQELADAVKRCGEGWYASEYVDKAQEFRVFVSQGRAVWVAEKTPADPDAVAWNVAKGGRFDNVRFDNWPLKVIRYAIEAFNHSGLDFGGVDVMVGNNGEVYVIEINSAPSQTSPYRQGCTAKAFDWICNNGKEHIPLREGRGGYKKFIHPAIHEGAELA